MLLLIPVYRDAAIAGCVLTARLLQSLFFAFQILRFDVLGGTWAPTENLMFSIPPTLAWLCHMLHPKSLRMRGQLHLLLKAPPMVTHDHEMV